MSMQRMPGRLDTTTQGASPRSAALTPGKRTRTALLPSRSSLPPLENDAELPGDWMPAPAAAASAHRKDAPAAPPRIEVPAEQAADVAAPGPGVEPAHAGPSATGGTGAALPAVQRHALSGGAVAPGVEQTVSCAVASSGSPLPGRTRVALENSFGWDLSSVRIHAGIESARAADALHADAFTVGKDIHFAAGRFEPDGSDGQRLLAHEVTHTLQEPTGGGFVSDPSDASEREADHLSREVVDRGSAAGPVRATTPHVSLQQRVQPAPISEERLNALARRPFAAITAWRRISDAQRLTLVMRMAEVFDGLFANEFAVAARAGHVPSLSTGTDGQQLPSLAMLTTRNLQSWGYRLLGMDGDNAIWTRANGDEFIVLPNPNDINVILRRVRRVWNWRASIDQQVAAAVAPLRETPPRSNLDEHNLAQDAMDQFNSRYEPLLERAQRWLQNNPGGSPELEALLQEIEAWRNQVQQDLSVIWMD